MPIIYWIHYPEHTDVMTEGYVGITDHFDTRMRVHKKEALVEIKSPKDQALVGERSSEIIIDIIFDGSPLQCADEEKRLRPSKNIGWNVATGGAYSRLDPAEKLQRRILQGWVSPNKAKRLIEGLDKSNQKISYHK